MILKRSEVKSMSGLTNLNEAQMRTKYFSSDRASVKVFLSHKHQDVDELFAVKRILERCGAEPYVDWMDEDMSEITNIQTAIDLKQKIHECQNYIFIATMASLEAPWCNWEIGYGDAMKYEADSIAIFPIKEDNGEWKRHEYLRLYPTIEYEDGTSEYTSGKLIPKGFYVEWPAGENTINIKPLKEWLLKGQPYVRML